MDYTASMSGKSISFAILQILLLHALHMIASEMCPFQSPGIVPNLRSCDRGCCGTEYNDYNDVCCADVVIVGSVVGGLGGLAILIGFIVCCCHTPRAVMHHTNTKAQTIVLNITGAAHVTPANPGLPYGYAGYPHGGAPPEDVQYENVPPESSIYSTISI